MSPLTHAISRSTWYFLLLIYVSMLAVVAAGIWYTNYTADQANRRWCGVLRVYHDAYAGNPAPTTQAGRDIRNQLERLYADFRCDTVRKPSADAWGG
jgi:hypothetical protein